MRETWIRQPGRVMTVVERLVEAGGLSTRAALLAHFDRLDIDKALAAGEIVAVGRGRYALPIVDEGVLKAHALSGLLSLTSAALHHGWEVRLRRTSRTCSSRASYA